MGRSRHLAYLWRYPGRILTAYTYDSRLDRLQDNGVLERMQDEPLSDALYGQRDALTAADAHRYEAEPPAGSL